MLWSSVCHWKVCTGRTGRWHQIKSWVVPQICKRFFWNSLVHVTEINVVSIWVDDLVYLTYFGRFLGCYRRNSESSPAFRHRSVVDTSPNQRCFKMMCQILWPMWKMTKQILSMKRQCYLKGTYFYQHFKIYLYIFHTYLTWNCLYLENGISLLVCAYNDLCFVKYMSNLNY